MADASVRALILAGGSGTRLWPRSTDSRPKPFLALAGGESLLRATFRRAAAVVGADRVFVSGRASHAPLLRAELPEVPDARLVLEPVRRNTAPAIALSALVACADDANAVMLVLPSDQAVSDEPAFLAAADRAQQFRRFDAYAVERILERTNPERAAQLADLAQGDADERWRYYEQLAGMHRSVPHLHAHASPPEAASVGAGRDDDKGDLA